MIPGVEMKKVKNFFIFRPVLLIFTNLVNEFGVCGVMMSSTIVAHIMMKLAAWRGNGEMIALEYSEGLDQNRHLHRFASSFYINTGKAEV